MTIGLKRKVIRIKAEDSPNVRLAMAEIAAGREPSGNVLVPGVKQWWEYKTNRRDWDPHQQCVSLDADWYEGADVKMFPVEWLNRAEQLAEEAKNVRRTAVAMGVDTGEGSAETALCAVDYLGLVALESRRTPDTSVIPGWVLAFAREHGVPADKIMFDQGGGGLEHADQLRRQGYNVKTVAFGSTIAAPVRPRGVINPLAARKELVEERYVYKNRRAEMYHRLRLLLKEGFAISRDHVELRRQLAPVPLWYDREGRIYLPPKSTQPGDDDDMVTMTKLIGCSPDQSDALVLAVHGMTARVHQQRVSSMV
jgi:hypothetical protein